jgi:hypothetical protein
MHSVTLTLPPVPHVNALALAGPWQSLHWRLLAVVHAWLSNWPAAHWLHSGWGKRIF